VLAELSPNPPNIVHEQITIAYVGVNVKAVVEADTCDLSCFGAEQFDAVLCLGR